ncbi:MAG: hypothetical protein M1816_006720 [Peltula sp. TS41687]|nr:MAG: hypothetical protein M1816_006720 [Peltula sp. TS41687]
MAPEVFVCLEVFVFVLGRLAQKRIRGASLTLPSVVSLGPHYHSFWAHRAQSYIVFSHLAMAAPRSAELTNFDHDYEPIHVDFNPFDALGLDPARADLLGYAARRDQLNLQHLVSMHKRAAMRHVQCATPARPPVLCARGCVRRKSGGNGGNGGTTSTLLTGWMI